MLKILRRTPLRHFSTSTRRLAEVEVFVNGQSVMIEQGSAVIQAAEKLGVTIPR
jgi:NADH dehydrogenase (ubiquinone) Fe-S protein 1